jgi:hypothetical protein
MPGTIIRERQNRVARSLPTDTGVLFLVGTADRGPVGSALGVDNIDDFVKKFGDRTTYSSAYDELESFFRLGGRSAYFSREVGPAADVASVDLLDAGGAVALTVQARGPGAWANTRNVAVEAGDNAGEFKLHFTDDVDTTIDETSPSFVDSNAAVVWGQANDDLEIVLGISANDPAVAAAQSLAGGADDRANISDATAAAALTAFTKDLGPGQVAFANRSTSTAHGMLADHAAANNRAALYDPPDTQSKTTLDATANAIHLLDNARHGALFGPWVDIPGLTGVAASRRIPPAAIIAGQISTNDSTGHTTNEPSAGELGVLDWVTGLAATFSDTDANDLNDNGVNLIREVAGDFRIYGYRSGVRKDADENWWQFGNVRLYMELAAKADNILQGYVFRQVDGRGLVFKELEGELVGMLAPYWEAGSLYGPTPQDAFYVDTGPQVNTAETIGNGEIRAALELTMSPMGETVILEIVKRQIGR